MAVLRRYVVPVIWMLLLGVIALALAKMAFFPSADANATQDPVVPGAEFDEYALVAAETGDISSTLELSGTVEADEGDPLKATTSGEVNKIWRHDGDAVTKGERVLQVRYPVEPDPLPETATEPASGAGDADGAAGDAAGGADGEGDADGDAAGAADGASAGAADGSAADAAAQQPAPTSSAIEYRYVNLVASASGTLTDMEVQEQDELAKGDVVATLSPGTYSIRADLTPEQQLSLLDVELEATATVPTTQDPVACTAPSIDEDEPGAGTEQLAAEAPADPAEEALSIDGEPAETGGDTSLAQLTCPVPADVKVVPGLEVEVTVALGSRSDVLTVPTTAVEGEASTGTVYVLDEETGEPAPVEVELGLRQDGRVEITGGLEDGQEILEFVPGVDAPNQDEGMVW
jgi:multidrug efflux pump subunit AcrA (membrane-fusion protein)